MSEDEFQFLVTVARLPTTERKQFVVAADRQLGVIAKEVVEALLGSPNKGTASTAWLAVVEREAKSR